MREPIKLRLHYKGDEITDVEIRKAMAVPPRYGAMDVDGTLYHVVGLVVCVGDDKDVAADVWLEEAKKP